MKLKVIIVSIAIILLSCIINNRDTITVNDNIDNDQNVFMALESPNKPPQTGGYEFKNNGKYHVLQDSANVMEEPNGAIVAVLNLNDEVEILEKIDMEERKDGVRAYWYKIKCRNVSGFMFGGHIAVKTLVTDIDNNGINDYFYFRISDYNKYYWRQWDKPDLYFNSHNDVIIYINGKRISTNMLNEFHTSLYLEDDHEFNWCEFEKKDNNVLIKLIKYFILAGEWGYQSEQYLYSINGNGNIAHLEFSIWRMYYGGDFQTDGMDSWELVEFFDKDGMWLSFEYAENNWEYKVIGEKTIDGKVWANVMDLGGH